MARLPPLSAVVASLVLAAPAAAAARVDVLSIAVLAREATLAANESIVLIRVGVFRQEVMPAYRNLVDKGDVGPLVSLLRRARPLAPRERGGMPVEALEREMSRLREDAVRARANGNVVPSQELGDRLWALVHPSGPSLLTQSEIDLAVSLLSDSGAPGEQATRLVNEVVVRGLTELLCIPWNQGVEPAQEVGSSLLGEYLETRADWIRSHVVQGGPRGPELELPGDEWIGVYSEEEVRQFRQELIGVDRPMRAGLVQRQYDTLRSIVEVASRDATLVLARWSR